MHELLRCLVDPYVDLLDTGPGRSYVRIVAQLRGRFAVWRVESDTETTAQLASILDEVEQRLDLPPALRRERMVAMIMVLTATTAERARRIDEGAALDLSAMEFRGELVDMCAALLIAPRS